MLLISALVGRLADEELYTRKTDCLATCLGNSLDPIVPAKHESLGLRQNVRILHGDRCAGKDADGNFCLSVLESLGYQSLFISSLQSLNLHPWMLIGRICLT